MKVIKVFSWMSMIVLFSQCIGKDVIDDYVAPSIRIAKGVDSLKLGDEVQFQAMYFNNIGKEEEVNFIWSSSDTSIFTIDASGFGMAKNKGDVEVEVRYQDVSLKHGFVIGDKTVGVSTTKKGIVKTTSSYALSGNFEISPNDNNGIVLSFSNDYKASNALPALYVYLTNNPSTTAGALEIGPVSVFTGSHSYIIPNTSIDDYKYVLYFCKPFNVKVGDGEIK